MRVILGVNSGSSSVKLALFDADTLAVLERRTIDGSDGRRRDAVLDDLDGWLDAHGATLAAASHRVVHGGTRYAAPVLVAGDVLDDLEALIPLAPLHQPGCVAPIRALAQQRPGLVQVACFDTAFHRGRPTSVERYALPAELFERGIRRYGFHGLSCEYVTSRLRELDPAVAAGRVVVAHLGSGASLCAIRNGRSVDSTMGFSTLDGLVMGTRPGSLDAGAVLHLLRDGRRVDDVERTLYRESGLLGVSGISADVRVLLASGDPRATEALDCMVTSVRRALGAMVAMLGGLDALVFTGGIGEHSAAIRERIAHASAWTGLAIDDDANRVHATRLSAVGAPVSAWVIPTDEETMLARHARPFVAAAAPS